MNRKKLFFETLDRHIAQVRLLKESYSIYDSVEKAVELIVTELGLGKPLLVFGNGGSASDAQHITAELVGRFMRDRRPIHAICLNANMSIITAWSNDDHFDNVFSRQIEAFPTEQAVALGISTSGRSPNVLNGIKAAKDRGFKTISLTGAFTKDLADHSDVLIGVPANLTRDIQELHVLVYHYLCERIEQLFLES